MAEKQAKADEVVIDALKTKIKVLDQELLQAHETIEELEATKKEVQEKLQKMVQGE